MTGVIVPLAGLLAAAGVYLVLSRSVWQRLMGILLLGQALPLILLIAGGPSAHASAPGLAVALIALGWFLAEAGKLRAGPRPPDTRS